MPTSSIDDLLADTIAGKGQPMAPEMQPSEEEISEIQQKQQAQEEDILQQPAAQSMADDDEEVEANAKPEVTEDEYGNPSPKAESKTYTEEEVNNRINQAIRDRFARMERNQPNQGAQDQVRQAAQKDFEYDPESKESWQQQLETFVETTVTRMSQKQAQQAFNEKEQRAQAEFEAKFHQGMTKFGDFTQVVGSKNITDAMVIATRSMTDPAAFMYAAAKRMPQELERIAKMDPYAQMVEIGKLEEKLKKTREPTRAPKPAAKVSEDMGIPHKSEKEPSIEDLIAKSNARRIAMRNRHKR